MNCLNRNARTRTCASRALSPLSPIRLALCAALACAAPGIHAAHAQFSGNQNGNGGTIPLPDGVRNVVGIDAQNTLLVELEPSTPGGPTEYRALKVQHVYVGGIARLFGGQSISTEEFVSPAFSKQGGFGQNGGGQNGSGFNNGFNNGFGGQNGFNNGLNGQFTGQGNGFPNGFNTGNGVPNGGFASNGYPNGYPNGYQNGYPNFGGGFTGSPQITYGLGNLIRTQNLPIQIQTQSTNGVR